MSDMQEKLGYTLLKRLSELRQEKGEVSLEALGAMFEQLATSISLLSPADRFMHEEIARLAQYIADAKKEIFAISTNDKSEAVIVDASAHLDEVIKDTEKATNTIMDAADAIQSAAAGIDAEKEKAIMEAATRIYEACNFQDVTGQRIRKVIKLLENIESRIDKLNSLFGNEATTAANSNQKDSALPPAPSDKDLMNGPQMNASATSQADIDALFASLGGKA